MNIFRDLMVLILKDEMEKNGVGSKRVEKN